MPPIRSRPARDRLLAAASVLFYNNGIGATGVDAISARAGVAKMSFYNNFASKADLVATFLDLRHQEWLDLYEGRLVQATTPKERVLAVFEAYADHANCEYERGFRGCGLLNAAAELAAGDPGRDAVRRHKEQVEAILAEHLGNLLPNRESEAARLAMHLAFLLEGSISRAGLEGNDTRVQHARQIAAAMLEAL